MYVLVFTSLVTYRKTLKPRWMTPSRQWLARLETEIVKMKIR